MLKKLHDLFVSGSRSPEHVPISPSEEDVSVNESAPPRVAAPRAGHHPQASSFENMLGDLMDRPGRGILVNEIILETHRKKLESILAMIEQEDCDAARRQRVWNGLRAAAAASECTNARLLAIWCFERLRSVEARHRIVAALADEDYGVRGAAAKALKGKIGADDLEALASLVDAAPGAEGSEPTNSKEEILVAIGRVTGAAAALEMLASIGDPRVPELMARAMDHPNARVRRVALAQSANLGLKEHAALAARHLADADAAVQLEAAALLSQIGDASYVAALVQWMVNRPGASADEPFLRMVQRHRHAACQELVRFLGDSSPDRRRAAVTMIPATGDSAAISSLIAALQDPDQDVAAEAARALGRIGEAAAIEPLTAAARRAVSRDERILRGRVSDALKRLGGKAAVDRAFGEPSNG